MADDSAAQETAMVRVKEIILVAPSDRDVSITYDDVTLEMQFIDIQGDIEVEFRALSSDILLAKSKAPGRINISDSRHKVTKTFDKDDQGTRISDDYFDHNFTFSSRFS